MGKYIRLNNYFILRIGTKYFMTDVKKPKEWKKMSTKQRKEHKQEDITKKMKTLLKKYKLKSSENINILTHKSKKKIKSQKKMKSKKMKTHKKGGSTLKKVVIGG